MPRPPRVDEAGGLYHALNRAIERRIFRKPADYEALERVLAEGLERYRVELYLLSVDAQPLAPRAAARPRRRDEPLLALGTATHTMRYHAHRRTSGEGHVYQGRFKSFPIQDDAHFLAVCRYVERNAVRAELVKRAEAMALGLALAVAAEEPSRVPALLSAWTIPRSAKLDRPGQQAADRA